jgi:hypothetical protein
MAVSKLRKAGMTYDKKTGRKRRVNLKRSRAAKKAARKRRHKRLKPSTRKKISKAIRVTLRRHRTKSGRRVLRKVRHVNNKVYNVSRRPKITRRVRTLGPMAISTFHDIVRVKR